MGSECGRMRQTLPNTQWITDIATFAEAWQQWQKLRQHYGAALGRGESGFFVASPNSGLLRIPPPAPALPPPPPLSPDEYDPEFLTLLEWAGLKLDKIPV